MNLFSSQVEDHLLMFLGKRVEAYFTVACFLAQEGADIHFKNRIGDSPFDLSSPELQTALIHCASLRKGLVEI